MPRWRASSGVVSSPRSRRARIVQTRSRFVGENAASEPCARNANGIENVASTIVQTRSASPSSGIASSNHRKKRRIAIFATRTTPIAIATVACTTVRAGSSISYSQRRGTISVIITT